MCYNVNMKTKPLIETNPYLKDANMRRALVARSVRTSCGVEGIKKNSTASAARVDLQTYKRDDQEIISKGVNEKIYKSF